VKGGTTVAALALAGRRGAGRLGTLWSTAEPDRVVKLCPVAAPFSRRLPAAAARLAAFRHPGVAPVHAIQRLPVDGRPVLAMVRDWVPGTALPDALARQAPAGLAWPRVRCLGEELLETLAAATAAGIAHGNLHPENLILTPDGRCVLTDFDFPRGPAAAWPERRGWSGPADWLPPEAARPPPPRRGSGPARADLFSLAVCLYQAATGVSPFPELRSPQTGLATFLQAWRSPQPPEPDWAHPVFSWAPGLRELLAAWLAPEPARRPASFAAALAVWRRLPAAAPRLAIAGLGAVAVGDGVGRGGHSLVFKGLCLAAGRRRQVAVKTAGGRLARRLQREAELLRALRHPAIVRALGWQPAAAAGGWGALVLEWLPDWPDAGLRARLRKARGRGHGHGLPAAEMIRLFRRLAATLAWLHGRPEPVAHGDLKPANLYAPPGKPAKLRLLDFSSARSGAAPGWQPATTPGYRPPPGTTALTPSQRDLFGFGCCLYEALTGRPAVPQRPATAPFLLPACREPVFRRRPELATIVRRALAAGGATGYGSADELLADFRPAGRRRAGAATGAGASRGGGECACGPG
jgi:serine/threonine protein kinase